MFVVHRAAKVVFGNFLGSIIVCLTFLDSAVYSAPSSEAKGVHFCGTGHRQPDSRRYARSFAPNLNVGEPRTVRMIYFLPNDRPYRAEVVQKMKVEIRTIQTFYAEQMAAHGYGDMTFRIETDSQGEPMVHRVDGWYPDIHYLQYTADTVIAEVTQAFDLYANAYLIVIDNSSNLIGSVEGIGSQWGKKGGYALVSGRFDFQLAAHELGHTFGMYHDFNNGAYMMSYGPGQDRLSACHAEYLSVQPYFNRNASTSPEQLPTIELLSPGTYPAGARSVPVRLRISHLEGLRQVILFVNTIEPHPAAGSLEVKLCRGLAGEVDAVVEFDYDGIIPSDAVTTLSDSVSHTFFVDAVDMNGDVESAHFGLAEISPHHIVTLGERSDWVAIETVAFSLVDAGLLAAASLDNTVKLWDVATRRDIATLQSFGLSTMAFSSDGMTLAIGTSNGEVKLWDVMTGRDIATFKEHAEWIVSMSFSSDGRHLASGSGNGTVRLWDVAARQIVGTFTGHTDAITSLSFSSDGRRLASGAYDGTIKVWEVATGQNTATLGHGHLVLSVSFSPVDTTLLATGGWDYTAKLWDVERQQHIGTLAGHTSGVTSLSFSRDGSTLASGSRDNTVKLWDVLTRVNFATLPHSDSVHSVSFSNDDTTLASGTRANTVELWDMSGLMGIRVEATTEIDISDSHLRAAIAKLVKLPPNSPIFRAHLSDLFRLEARNAGISDLTGLESATNLRVLNLWHNFVSDISAVAGLTNLNVLHLGGNSVSDISAVSDLTRLTDLILWDNNISDLSAVASLTNLRNLHLAGNYISDVSPLAANTGLGSGDTVDLRGNPLSYQSIRTHIPTLESRGVAVVFDNQAYPAILKISGDNQRGMPGETLANPFVVEVQDENGSALAGIEVMFTVDSGGGTLNVQRTTTNVNGRAQSTLTLAPNLGVHTVSASVGGIHALAIFYASAELPTVSTKMPMFTLSIPAGVHLIHIPLAVKQINGEDRTIETVGDVYDALGDSVHFIVTFVDGSPISYLGDESAGSMADAAINDDTGLIVAMKEAVRLELAGDALGVGGESRIGIGLGYTLVGVPLDPAVGMMISGLLVGGVREIAVSQADGVGFSIISRNNLAADAPIVGGAGYVVAATVETSISVMGSAWKNTGAAAAPSVVFDGAQTPVLYVEGGVMDEFGMLAENPDLRVTVKNLSTGGSLDAVIGTGGSKAAYSGTFVELSRHAAKAGDVLEIAAHSPSPHVGARPVPQIVVSAEDVLASRIELPDLELYEIPSETELLQNYPNPFNPETWIPYQLSEDSFVSVSIYDATGNLIRTLSLGFQSAGFYNSRARSAYWDGRNDNGESVASGVYFYRLEGIDYTGLRRMVIIK